MAFNGMRRFLGGTTQLQQGTDPEAPATSTAELSSPTSPASPGTTTKAAFFRKNSGPSSRSSSRDRSFGQSISDIPSSSVRQTPRRKGSSLSISSSPPMPQQQLPRPSLPSLATAISSSDLNQRAFPATSLHPSSPSTSKNISTFNIKDELLISLLASQAVVDSRDAEMLSSEDVDELKREHALLSSRVASLTKKVALETKLRDAALKLQNLDQSQGSKQTNDQLDAANRKVHAAQQELLKVSSQANEIQQKLLEHRAAVLSFTMRGLEKKVATMTGRQSSGIGGDTDDSESGLSGEMSPASTTATSLSLAPKKFDGAHFFAGHADALTPVLQSSYSIAAFKELEEKLKKSNEALQVSQKKQADLSRDLSMAELERTEIETKMSLDLQAAEDKIASLRDYLDESQEKAQRDLDEMEELRESNEKLASVEESVETLKKDLVRKEYDVEKLQEEKKALESEKENLKQSLESSKDVTNQEVTNAQESLRAICLANRITLPAGADVSSMLTALENHLKGVDDRFEQQVQQREQWDESRRELEKEIRTGLENRERLNRELEDARREREEARTNVRLLEAQVKDQLDQISELESRQAITVAVPTLPAPGLAGNELYDELVNILKPLWTILPSTEARAAKASSLRGPTPRSPKGLRSPDMSPSLSLSDLDVRSLKSLYELQGGYTSPGLTGEFHAQEFVNRIQALVTDDKALVERLIRFAHAHDLLKSNADRATKLAQESSLGLETYQKQVKTLEDRNAGLTAKQTALMDEVEDLQHAIEKAEAQLREMEERAAEQAETCKNLTEANNTLSAKTLSLAAEAADNPEKIKQMEARINELTKSLKEANDDLDAIRAAESMQRVALLDELNAMQQENSNLRNQLRARK
ncbi:hypothetical protein FRC03_012516 [Tulasnella sp. 419]|nr:hypothetical protein FRC03_012516 [Tulasnella sp. 419]